MKCKRCVKFILVLVLLFGIKSFSQVHSQDDDRYSVQVTTDNVVFQKGLLYAGVEFSAEFSNGIYIRPQIHYAALEDGYLETSSGMGINLAYGYWNYKVGIKLGVINRVSVYPIFGAEFGLEYHITDKVGIGLRGSYDARGDSSFYGGDSWVYNSQGYIKFVL